MHTQLRLRHINNVLSLITIVLGLYITLGPFVPQIVFLLRDTSPSAIAPYQGRLADNNNNTNPQPAPKENRIVIPSLSLDEPVNEGRDISVINQGGTWRRPQASNPQNGGNTVIVGHRYFASQASTFYNLDKVAIGDQIAIYWDEKEYIYEVNSKKIVKATAVEIEAPSQESILTLYTCHPLWTARDRLVLTANLIEG